MNIRWRRRLLSLAGDSAIAFSALLLGPHAGQCQTDSARTLKPSRTTETVSAKAARDAPLILNPDTGWCWFQDERAIIDNGQLLLAGVSSHGDITVTVHHLASGDTAVHVLHPRLQANDHAVPALMVLPDGRYLASYSKHGGDATLWRISERSGDASAWHPEQRFDHGARVTYSNLYFMADEGRNGRVYNFIRAYQWDPSFIVSEDHGASWRAGGRLIDGGAGSTRPYVRYKGNGANTIHFITTEGHPNRHANSIYHGYIRGGKAFRSDGTAVSDDVFSINAPPAQAFTRVFQGDEKNVAWTSDIELDSGGHPYVAYSVMKDALPLESGMRGNDHRYHYARWDGTCWRDYEIAYAGSRLYPKEPEYTGLIALHPLTPNVVYISADVYPNSGKPIVVAGQRRYEIFEGVTEDEGKTWRWSPVTSGSSQDNLRPHVAARGDTWAVVWLRGEYRAYTDYSQAAVGLIQCGRPE